MNVLRLRPSVHSREVEGEVVAVDVEGGQYLGVNPSGALLWPLLEAGTTIDLLADALVDHYELSRDAALRDIEAWLGWLREHHLLAP